MKDKHGNPAATLANAVIAIKALGVGCRLDLFHRTVLVDYQGECAEIRNLVGELTDDTLGAIRSVINNRFGLDVGDANTLAAVKEIARDNAFDPVLDYLDKAQSKLDGVERIGTWLTDYCGAPDSPFVRAVGRKHLVASVRRPRQPGCKYDDILVMEAPEGRNKSTAIAMLAGKENFSDQTILGVSDREAQELMTGVWLYEIADLTDIAKADVNRVKAFASRTTDRARPAYGRVLEKRPRRCTLWATTNDSIYLKSQTGNRRFLPVPVARIDLDRLRSDRDQLWGEAAAAEANGDGIFLEESLWATAAEEQEKRRTVDPWEDVLAEIPESIEVGDKEIQIIWTVDGQERVASADLLTYLLGVPVYQRTTAHGQRLAVIMERLGWRRPNGETQRINGVPVRGYWRPTEKLPLGGDSAAAAVPRRARIAAGKAAPAIVKKVVAIVEETEKGIKVAGGEGVTVWLPRSKIKLVPRPDELFEIEIPKWLAAEKGMEAWGPAAPEQAAPGPAAPGEPEDREIPF